ncbi:MAG: esterase-like activity of phytase family protein, partial [Gammaproteobacteria bacterium]
MRFPIMGLTSAAIVMALPAYADQPLSRPANVFSSSFNRVASFANYTNRDAGDETVSEIVAATQDGMTLVYTDAAAGAVGFVDISDPSHPQGLGSLDLQGEPTSVDVLGNHFALVAVNTSASYVDTSGDLIVVDIASQSVVATIPLGGQPDSLKISADELYAAIAIENERDEDLDDGLLPQLPAGFLVVVDMPSPFAPAAWTTRTIDLTGLAGCDENSDPEPEFVDINADNLAVISMQENNCLALVGLANGTVEDSFSTGAVNLTQIDATEDGIISLTESLDDVVREPDAVAWVENLFGDDAIATANEGDLFGGSRGFSLFGQDGSVLYDSGNSFEHLAARHGHYPEDRSENKGSEPEAVEFGRFGSVSYLFVGSERGSFVVVYEIDVTGMPVFKQFLPAPLGPEGLLAIPSRNLLVASGEEDDPTFGVRSTMMIYELGDGAPQYPQIQSANDANGTPIPWGALSGMTAAPRGGHELLAVWDSYYSESRILTIDAKAEPATIIDAITIKGGTGNFDPEGIAVAPDGGSYWIASEGNASSRRNRLLQTDLNGTVLQEIELPAVIEACRAASTATGTLGSGFEGVTAIGSKQHYVLLIAQQRGWDYTTPECEDLDDDAGGLNANGQPNQTRIWIYDPQTGDWDHISWDLAPLPATASWVGLSEITAAQSSVILIERDNRTGDWSEYKTLASVALGDLLDGSVTAAEKTVFDL